MLEASAGAGATWRTLLIRSPLFHALSAVCPYSSPYQDGKCPLIVAFEKQLFEIVQLLIAAGANVNVSDKVSST